MTIFREEALNHRRAPEGVEVLTVAPPWTWSLFLGLSSIVGLFLLWSIFGRVPVTERGKGIILPVGGSRPLVSTVAGRVAAVRARNGQFMKAGETILEIEAPTVSGPALVASRDKATAEEDLRRMGIEEERVYQAQKRRVQERIQSARSQLASLNLSCGMQAKKVEASGRLEKEGLLSPFQVDEAREGLEAMRRQQDAARQALVAITQEQAALDSQYVDRSLQRRRELERVSATAEGQSVALGQASIVATVDGVVEGLQVNPGDSIQVGDELGRVVPDAGPLEVVAFLPERHQAFVKGGNEAYLEIDQLPYGEFGSAKARVKRVARSAATPREIQAVLGSQGAPALVPEGVVVRVELDILDQRPAQKAGVRLVPGMRTQVRFQIRRQSLMAMLAAPLRRWID